MRYKANKWVLGLLLFLMIISFSFISIKSTKADTIVYLNTKFTRPSGIPTNTYTLGNAQLCELNSSISNIQSYLGNTGTGSTTTNIYSDYGYDNWFAIIPFKYLMLYQASELEPLNMNLYTTIINFKVWLTYDRTYGDTAVTQFNFLLFGVNQSILPFIYNYIVDNNLLSSSNTSAIFLNDFEEQLNYLCVSGLFSAGFLSSTEYGDNQLGNYLIFDEKPIKFIALPQNIVSPVSLTTTQLNQQRGYAYTWTRLFATTSLSSFAPVNMNNDRLLMQYYGYIDYWELTSQSINAIEGVAYQEGYDSGISSAVQDVLANPSQYGLYSSAQYTAYGLQQYNNGLAIGRETPYKTGDWFMTIFRSIGDVLAIEIFPGLSIGLIVMIPLSISLAWFIIRTLRGGGN